MKNLNLKIFSLLMAIILAYFVNSENNASVVGFVVPVEVKNLPDSKVLLWPLTPQTRVTVKGPSYLTSRIAASSTTFKVNIPQDASNRISIQLSESDLALPPSVQVLAIDPKEITFSLDNKIEKQLPVSVLTVGSLPENLKLEHLNYTPTTITISGPETEIKPLEKLETEPFDLREVSQNTIRKILLKAPGSLIRLASNQIELNVEVSALKQVEHYKALTVEVRSSLGLKANLTPNIVNLEIVSTPDNFKHFNPSNLFPYVRIDSEFTKGQSKVMLDLPAGFEIKSIVPEYVNVVIDQVKSNKSVKNSTK